MAPRKNSNAAHKKCFCGKPDSDTQVLCDLCDRMIHYSCMGSFSAADLEKLINDKPGNYVCAKCAPPPLTSDESDALKKQSQYDRVWMYREPPAAFPSRSGSGETPVFDENFFQRIVSAATKAATEAAIGAAMRFVTEHLEQKDKKNNLVIVGLPENENDEMKQRCADTEKVTSYCSKLGIPEHSIVSTFREGKIRGRRVLKVCFRERHITERRLLLARGTDLVAV